MFNVYIALFLYPISSFIDSQSFAVFPDNSSIISVNIGIALFNLLPIPPLDGASIVQGILSIIRAPWDYRISEAFDRVQAQGYTIFILLILVDQILPISILGLVLEAPYRLLYRLMVGL